MAFFDDTKQWWMRLAERERRLIILMGAVAVVCILGFFGMMIRSGLSEIEARNAEMREALHLLETRRDDYLEMRDRQHQSVVAMIGDEAPALSTYLEGIANEVGITIPESRARQDVPKGRFVEKAIDIKLRGVSITELAEFLKKVETKNPIVVSQRLSVKTYFNQPEKLDAEITVATYQRASKSKGKKGEGESDDS